MEYHGKPVGGFSQGGKSDHGGYGSEDGLEQKHYADHAERMSEKGLIACENNGRMRTYIPLIERETAVKKETESFLKRVYQGSIHMLVSGFVEKQRLSQEELAELREILDKAEEEWYE